LLIKLKNIFYILFGYRENNNHNLSKQQHTLYQRKIIHNKNSTLIGKGAIMNFFGTDGIRGTYGGSTLNDGTAFLLGKSLALLGHDCPIIVVARDTRNSGERLFQCLSQGIYEGGGNVINLGVLPTNSVGHFVRKFGGDYGVMITASHNPPNDNGLKVFDKYGVKLCSAKQKVVSAMMSSQSIGNFTPQGLFEPVFYDIQNIYAEDVSRAVDVRLEGLRVALDCCYGASYRVASKVFEKSGAMVTSFCDTICGDKINVNCGATHTEFLQSKLAGGNFHLGFAFDGDCDRLAVFEGEKFVPNNKVYYAICKYLKECNSLKKDTVVSAVNGILLSDSGEVILAEGEKRTFSEPLQCKWLVPDADREAAYELSLSDKKGTYTINLYFDKQTDSWTVSLTK
jgi:phosphoglucosamine mutase